MRFGEIRGSWALFLLIFTPPMAHGKCAPSPAYPTSLEIVTCQERNPKDPSQPIHFGAILEVKVLWKKQGGSSLPEKLRLIYNTGDTAPCRTLSPGVTRRGIIRLLCCDGGEPGCDWGIAYGVYDLKNLSTKSK